ncbi:60S acidic ribosomal protein P1 [Sciurus carolinensis]|uniref:Large ribosomal subunit protein P1 n=1 Tax=Sciurus carolinensis TaxID=30640 RepID=A0AA41SW44_SCICA|nr:60S acidic ribosomal protein P1-like [Sciurus carolinensis]MBZ3873647.1 60S acidic ribosomal protein P1 [Sciurus carolinensis]
MAYISELTCIYSALVLQDDEMIVTERINALIKAADVKGEPFRLGVFAKALASINTGSLTGNVGAGGPALAAEVAPAGGPDLSTTATLAEEEKVEERRI